MRQRSLEAVIQMSKSEVTPFSYSFRSNNSYSMSGHLFADTPAL
jgi:hypothetical protein